MKFSIEYTGITEYQLLTYITEEYSFDSSLMLKSICFDISLNYLCLTVIGDNNIARGLGFCPHGGWVDSRYEVPEYKKGILRVIGEYECGTGSYSIKKDDFPVYVNKKTGWICVGIPNKSGRAVEFLDGCVAVLEDNNELVSLWLKPKFLKDNQEVPLQQLNLQTNSELPLTTKYLFLTNKIGSKFRYLLKLIGFDL